jgi:hypothetical protein
MTRKNQERQKLQNKAGQVKLPKNDLIDKLKEEVIAEARAIALGTSNHLGRLVQLTKELIEEEAGE